MKRKSTIIVAILAACAFAGAGYLLGRHTHDLPPDKSTLTSQEEQVQYTCSMHPFIIRDEPGTCPICGMDLVPVKKGEGGAHSAAISVDPVTTQNMGVRLAPATRLDLTRSLRTVGTVVPSESLQRSISSKVEGYIERLYVDQTGRPVAKGAPLLEIYSPDLVAAQQEYLLAVQNSDRLATSPVPEVADSAARLRDAARTRLKYWDISDAQIRALEKSGTPKKTMTLYSPYSGIVMMKKALPGMRIMPGEELLAISDLSKIWVDVQLYEYQLPAVAVGESATVILPYDQQRLSGRISLIYPEIAGETRTGRARIELENRDLLLKPEMYVDVQIDAPPLKNVLTVPNEAILDSGAQKTVFVALGDGRFEPRRVETGVRDDQGRVEIRQGLKDGENVVVSAQFLLDSESRLREALQKMTPAAPIAPASAPGKTEKLDDLFK